jgi:preprotein translocase subunit YajC
MKKIKTLLSIITTSLFLIAIIVIAYIGIKYYNQSQEENRQNYINNLVQAEQAVLNGTSIKTEKPNTDTGKNPDGSVNLDDIVSGSVNDSKVESVFTNITMISASTFKATLNNEEKTFRLIGVVEDGNTVKIKQLLESLTGIVITQDVMKVKKDTDIQLIYLWNGDDSDINNMVNIQIVKNGLAKTTYTDAVNYPEGTNVKYSLQFIKASKS